MAGGGKREAHRAGYRRELTVQAALDGLVLLLRLLALAPFLERDEEEGAVGVIDSAQHAVADHRGVVLNARRLREDLLRLLDDFVRALQRGGIGQLDAGEDVALVFVRQETDGDGLAEQPGQHDRARQEHQRHHALVDQEPARAHVAVRGPAEHAVEPVEEPLQGPAALLLGPQQQGGQRGRKRQRVEGGDDHGDGDGDRELLVEPSGDARDEGGRDEHRGQDDGDGHDRAGDLLHAFEGGLLGREAVLDVVLHDLDHHDGVVHHQADGQHQAEQREGVDGEAKEREQGERADQRDRHRQQRNERRAPALQEEEHHQDAPG